MLSSLNSALARLSLSGQTSTYVSKMFASGRWWPQPQSAVNSIRTFSGNSNGTTLTKDSAIKKNACESQILSVSQDANECSIEETCSNVDRRNSEPVDLELFREQAAPVYAQPRGTGHKVYKTERGKNGELLADYVLFEDSMNKAKVTWNQYSTLSSEERDIYMAHLKALRTRRLWYKDPKSGYRVMCSSQLLLNGKCCGNGCRHCPYQHENAKPEIRKRRKWNGAFYV
ncbi:unnamed protein product [Anisakis simplex]|uniref:C3H1-type domain-containing protein n=1 Tax=Anisakis simplex TaxID=6269 RepID=A0A0M3K7S1_ANISI|nr:unnamed protein product [Anisakis simplex]